jgi:hypothetical protein
MEVPSVDDVPEQEEDEEDWALQYQAYLDEKDVLLNEDDDDKVPSKQEKSSPQGQDWAVEYAQYCIEKEKEFFESNRSKEL